MDHYLELLAFSSDLLVYVGERFGLNVKGHIYVSEALDEKATLQFTPAIGEGVLDMMRMAFGVTNAIYSDIKPYVAANRQEQFGRLCIEAAAAYFPSGYTHPDFLIYIAVITGVALLLYQQQVLDERIFEVTAGVMATVQCGLVLGHGFDCSPAAWAALTKTAEKITAATEDIDSWDDNRMQEILKGEWLPPPNYRA